MGAPLKMLKGFTIAKNFKCGLKSRITPKIMIQTAAVMSPILNHS